MGRRGNSIHSSVAKRYFAEYAYDAGKTGSRNRADNMRFSGLSPFTNIENVTASRTLGIEYTNNTGKLLLVEATAVCTTANPAETSIIFGCSPIATYQQANGINGGPATSVYACVSFIVPVGGTYAVTYSSSGAATCTLFRWIEVY